MAGRIMKRIPIVIISTIILAILSLFFIIPKEKIIVTIAYTTDLQGFITPHPYSGPGLKGNPLLGGSAYLATQLKKERKVSEANHKYFLLLDTGNFFSGQAEGNFFKGSSIIEIMNHLGYDALAVGPKDFIFGQENLNDLSTQAKFPFLSANLIEKDSGETPDYLKPYIIKEYKGIKIGIIGITTPVIFNENIKGLAISDPILTAQKYISILKNAGINVIVVLSNLGLEEDKRLAQEVKGIDIIIGGNDQEEFRGFWSTGDSKNRTLILESWHKAGAYYGIDLILDSKGRIIKYKTKWLDILVEKTKPDPETDIIVRKYVKAVEEKKKEVIGYAETQLSRSINGESTLGNWAADILRQKAKSDIALVGGLQADLKGGQITVGDVYNILPIIDRIEIRGFNLAILELSGEELKDILEMGVSFGLEKGEGILQVSGLKYTYDLKRRKWDRIVEVDINGERLDLDKKYKVAVNSYLAAGLGGYYKIKDARNRYDTDLIDFDILIEYIKSRSSITAPPLEERIIVYQ